MQRPLPGCHRAHHAALDLGLKLLLKLALFHGELMVVRNQSLCRALLILGHDTVSQPGDWRQTDYVKGDQPRNAAWRLVTLAVPPPDESVQAIGSETNTLGSRGNSF